MDENPVESLIVLSNHIETFDTLADTYGALLKPGFDASAALSSLRRIQHSAGSILLSLIAHWPESPDEYAKSMVDNYVTAVGKIVAATEAQVQSPEGMQEPLKRRFDAFTERLRSHTECAAILANQGARPARELFRQKALGPIEAMLGRTSDEQQRAALG